MLEMVMFLYICMEFSSGGNEVWNNVPTTKTNSNQIRAVNNECVCVWWKCAIDNILHKL